MAVIALDVGERRIGIAIADPSGSFALPLEVLERSALEADLAAIVEIAQRYDAETIVVGDPVRLSGERGLAAQKIDRFCSALARRYSGKHRARRRASDDGASDAQPDCGRPLACQAQASGR